jgi:hypothetical protein
MVNRRRWKVRWWIRVVGVAGLMVLLSQQLSTIFFVDRGEMPASEVPLGWATIATVALLVIVLCFRPYIELRDNGQLVLQGPIRKHSFDRQQVREVRPSDWGLRFTLTDGSHRDSIVCQNTWSLKQPRWFDVAEAVTGHRPKVK